MQRSYIFIKDDEKLISLHNR